MGTEGTDLSANEREQEELDWLLNSGVLGRSHNLTQMLKFICEKHFEGRASQITEHALAVEALGRRSDFNPQTDTIVRVTAHQLRKRLQDVYAGSGASRTVQIHIPTGQYAPSFVYKEEQGAKPSSIHADGTPGVRSSAANGPLLKPGAVKRGWMFSILLLVSVLLLGGVVFAVMHRRADATMGAAPGVRTSRAVMGRPVRALLGKGRVPYVDRAGNTWTAGNYCSGGTTLSEPTQRIQGTDDPTVFLGGVRGGAHCVFPVDQGIYEVHLLFAEDSDLQEARSRSVFSLNGGENISLDVVDDAGGDNIADTKVFRGVRPENDGTIHIDFVGEISALKAVEILPAPSEALLPIRIVAGSKPYKDSEGNSWLPDRYAMGGRAGQETNEGKAAQIGLYSSHRVGNFRYIVPVVPFDKYRVLLYFKEPWFGKENAGIGGSGSRVFNVWCNGATLLNNFDILREAGASPIVKAFDHVQATAQGKLEISFSPVINYALINAIEVVPEPNQ